MKEVLGNISTDQRKFTMVYHDFLDSNILDGKEKIIYILLKRYLALGSDEGQVFPKVETLMEQCQMTRPTVTNIIKSLKKKGILQVKRRGLNKSNIYTLCDYADIWKCESKEEIAKAIDNYELAKATELLEKNGYEVIKKESIADNTDQSINLQSSQNNQVDSTDNTTTKAKSQERYSFQYIKDLYSYEILVVDYPDRVIEWDYVINMLYDVFNSTKSTIRIKDEERPLNVVIKKLSELNYTNIIYAVDKVKGITTKIYNPRAYLLSAIYNSDDVEIATANQVNVDMQNGKI